MEVPWALPVELHVFSDNGKPYGDVNTGWWAALKKAKIEGLWSHNVFHHSG